jgi:Tfp pilus assembly protein PilZ
MKNILVVDNDPIMLHMFVGLLKSQGSGFVRILLAVNGQAALKVLANKEVHLLITGLHLPEKETLNLLSQLAAGYSNIRVVVMTDGASAMFCSKVKPIPSVIHFDQALDVSLLIRRVFDELRINYGGQLHGISLASFLQMMELEKRSCTVKVMAKAKIGTIYLKRGQPIAARTGEVTGKPAALQILTWQNVSIDIDYAPIAVPAEMDAQLMKLILESGRMVDEKQSRRTDQREHDRHDCLVSVDYDIRDWTYQSYMRDISEGGAYIETEQDVEVGQRLVMYLSSPVLESVCTVNATVTRRDPTGIGVRFEELSLKQKQVLRSLMESGGSSAANPSP